jgi:hypothetical protein
MQSAWSKRKSDRALALYREQATYNVIGKRLGRTGKAVRHHINARLAREGLERRPGPPARRIFAPAEIETARALAADGTGVLKIRAVLRCNLYALKDMMRANGIPLQKRSGTSKPKRNPNYRAPSVRPTNLGPRKRLVVEEGKPGRGKPFWDLRLRDCRFPTFQGRPPLEHRTFCAEPAREGSSFCENCHRIVYQQMDRRLGPPSLRAAA